MTTQTTPTRTYRGATLEELLPRIRAELGDDAVVLRQREGLAGGVAGFFQRPFVEVEACAGHERVDIYDDADDLDDAATSEALPGGALDGGSQRPQAAGEGGQFVSLLADACVESIPNVIPEDVQREAMAALAASENQAAARVLPGVADAAMVALPATAPAAAATIVDELVARGMSRSLATALVEETVVHELPFASPRSLRRLVRAALARRVTARSARPGRGCAIALLGPAGAGRSRLASGLAAAYRRGPLDVLEIALDDSARAAREARDRIETAGDGAIAIIDMPALPADEVQARSLASRVRRLGADERLLVVRATTSAAAARELIERARPLAPTALALTHADESSAIAGVIEAAIEAALPIAVLASQDGPKPVDPIDLATVMLP